MTKTGYRILSDPAPQSWYSPAEPGEAEVEYIALDGSLDFVQVGWWTPDGIEDAAKEQGIVSCSYCDEYCEPVLWEKGKRRDHGICHDCVFDPEAREWWVEYFANPSRSDTAVWWANRDVMLRFFRFILEAE